MISEERKRKKLEYIKAYYVAHREEKLAYNRKWAAENRDAIQAHAKARRTRKKEAGGRFILGEWLALKSAYGEKCLRCGKQEPEIRLVVDHVKPIAMGGSSNIDNIQPLCSACNSWKHAREVDFRDMYPEERIAAETALAPLRGLKRTPLSAEARRKIAEALRARPRSTERNPNLVTGAKKGWEKRGARPDCTSGIRNIGWEGSSNRWRVRAYRDGKRVSIGRYKTLEQAQAAFAAWAAENSHPPTL